MDKIDEILTRGVVNIIPDKDRLKKLLTSRSKLNIYLGIDPTATKIHLGHAVPLRKLQTFADFGHKVTFLIGDFTALIGDTSDKDSERPVLTTQQIENNFKTYKKQAQKILDFTKIEVKYNIPQSIVRKSLSNLTKHGLLDIKKEGRTKVYKANEIDIPDIEKFFEVPQLNSNIDSIEIKPKFSQKNIEKILRGINQNCELEKFETFYYPVYVAHVGRKEIVIDAVSGKEV